MLHVDLYSKVNQTYPGVLTSTVTDDLISKKMRVLGDKHVQRVLKKLGMKPMTQGKRGGPPKELKRFPPSDENLELAAKYVVPEVDALHKKLLKERRAAEAAQAAEASTAKGTHTPNAPAQQRRLKRA